MDRLEEMTDEEFQNASYESIEASTETVEETPAESVEVEQTAEAIPETNEVSEVKTDTPVENESLDISDEEFSIDKINETKKEVIPEVSNEVDTEVNPLNYEEFYSKVMKPFKANGKLIELKNPEEAIQLMQMGANYTRKMQDLQSVKKQLTMLEKNGLLDEGKLSYLIDLDKKNPEAIKKLIQEAGIDPLDIDTDTPTQYQEGNHRVTDNEVRFLTALDSVKAAEGGQETLQVIHSDWDQASKDELWNDPDVVEVIHEQRSNGIYQTVVDELNRQTALGTIKPGTPFLQAYKAVGNMLGARGAFAHLQDQGSRTEPKPVAPIATKAATPKTALTNNQRVAAAAPNKTGNSRAVLPESLAGLSDEEFMNRFSGRV